jgi:hypothetical protein
MMAVDKSVGNSGCIHREHARGEIKCTRQEGM